MSDHAALDAFIATLNIRYTWRFVPQHESRNAGDKQPSLNWIVTLQTNPHCSPLQTQYMQGIAHVPGYYKTPAGYDRRELEKAAVIGKYPANPNGFFSKTLPPPTLREILYSLVLDSSAINCASFEEWASEYGYETDSRKAEATYNECVRIGLQLRAMIGNASLEQLSNLFQDY